MFTVAVTSWVYEASGDRKTVGNRVPGRPFCKITGWPGPESKVFFVS